MTKKILILAGTHFQIPVIEYSKKMGHYVITCDNRPSNPGHKLANEYFNVSTTDLDGILKIAREKNIDAILVYGSDPAAKTAAYVSEILKLPGNSYKSVSVLSDKGMFRKFLKDNGFPVPVFKVFNSYNEAFNFCNSLKKGFFVKPVDSSGSKGISQINPGEAFKPAFDYAMEFSRKKEIIIEEEIERKGPHIHGEAFVHDGELVFLLLGDQYFSRITITAPMSTTVPSIFHVEIMPEIKDELKKIIKLVGYTNGGLNIEIIRNPNDIIYFNEIGARNGGNFMPDLVSIATGFKMAEANVDIALREPLNTTYKMTYDKYYTQLILHSHRDGIYQGLNLPAKFENNIRFTKVYLKKGDKVTLYKDSRSVIGVYLYEFQGMEDCHDFIEYIKMNDLIKLTLLNDKI